MARKDTLPKYHELMNPLMRALQDLGGSGSIEEIAAKVTESLDLPDDVLNLPHDQEKSSQTEIEYRSTWQIGPSRCRQGSGPDARCVPFVRHLSAPLAEPTRSSREAAR
jgi:hypothetical protein